uniref:Sulfiredoxin n=1 Tax=Rhizophora mucronata TaxID=61149 RepID=A0A2P2KF49_RHIMU
MFVLWLERREREEGGEQMAIFVLRVPATNLRSFSVSASLSNSNGGAPGGNNCSNNKGRGPVILELPLDKIRRPLMRTRANDPDKVKQLMDSIQEIGLQVPVSKPHSIQYYACIYLPSVRNN